MKCVLMNKFLAFYFPFLYHLLEQDFGAADDCSWQQEGAPRHVLFRGKMVGLKLEVVH